MVVSRVQLYTKRAVSWLRVATPLGLQATDGHESTLSAVGVQHRTYGWAVTINERRALLYEYCSIDWLYDEAGAAHEPTTVE